MIFERVARDSKLNDQKQATPAIALTLKVFSSIVGTKLTEFLGWNLIIVRLALTKEYFIWLIN